MERVRRAEARARAQVDRFIEQALTEARSQVTGFEEGIARALGDDRSELDRLKMSLETRLRELTPRLPSLPGLTGPA